MNLAPLVVAVRGADVDVLQTLAGCGQRLHPGVTDVLTAVHIHRAVINNTQYKYILD